MCKKSLTSKPTTNSKGTGGRCAAAGSYDTFVRTANMGFRIFFEKNTINQFFNIV